ncbi:hypothetical protein B0H17DRAFT_1284178 [Mycena rosella]|uniref:Uncharacterized protein n=1 Tax=Mycena rosella TaxID=1033263 RepID=A0AAD7DJE2_MYCRO|nr:hypothetical protein B0H17DRAFT_1284178 [Mycena rosella]
MSVEHPTRVLAIAPQQTGGSTSLPNYTHSLEDFFFFFFGAFCRNFVMVSVIMRLYFISGVVRGARLCGGNKWIQVDLRWCFNQAWTELESVSEFPRSSQFWIRDSTPNANCYCEKGNPTDPALRYRLPRFDALNEDIIGQLAVDRDDLPPSAVQELRTDISTFAGELSLMAVLCRGPLVTVVLFGSVLECAWQILLRELIVHIAEIAYNLGNTLLEMMASIT